MAESYCVELGRAECNRIGWFVPANLSSRGYSYYLSIRGTVEPDDGKDPFQTFYFATEQLAYEAMKKYFGGWGEPFPYEESSKASVQQLESATMKFK